ncbi:hypothetical protein SH139x_005399 [Planctomycetaceae bacterium SH139]
MSKQLTPRDDQQPSFQTQAATATHSHRSSLAIIIGGVAVLLAIMLVMAVSSTGPFAVAQQSDHAKAAPPVLKSQYTAKQIAAAKKHESYATFYNAQLIVVGKVAKEQGPVAAIPGAENRPPQFQWTLYPTQSLYINSQFAKNYESYDLGRVADADLKSTPYLLAQSFGNRQTYLGRADKDILQVAAIAIEQHTHADAVRLQQAKTNPEKNPLFKIVQDAENLATVDVVDGRVGVTVFDAKGNVIPQTKPLKKGQHVAILSANFRGKLPNNAPVGSFLWMDNSLQPPVESQPVLVAWELKQGKVHVTHWATMDEATLRITAAALKLDYKTFAIDAMGPQSFSSRGSFGPGGQDHHDHDHHEHADPDYDDKKNNHGGDPEADNPGVKDSE